MKDYDVFKQWLGDVMDVIYGSSHNWPFKALKKEMMKKPKRARGKKGRYLADDPTTKDVNEAWVGGKAPKKGKK
jgi:hypothetical protein|tara:strand:+ start:42 stop:263 length:222 start_codon:yes stop_codon:yes gene_type:complete